ncbi:porin, partial [Geitlerinema sp. P-1104]|uniref:iron uptake porin n=1 Tax=Geitlerinema sp. P-1104 TaxID=2546230 RepID=UPI0014769C9B
MQRLLMDIWEQGGPWITSIGLSLMVCHGPSPAWGKGLETSPPLKSITSVSELSDVEPTDWAYQALQSLIERYGCVTGLPGGRFEGRRSLTRDEFAAALNRCFDFISILPNHLAEEDVATLERLQRDFAAELSTLSGRVEDLTPRIAALEAQEFSPTLVMGGESIFALSAGFGGERGESEATNPVLTHLTRLGFVSSFTGRDRLRFEFQASNFANRGFASPSGFNTDMALLSFQGNTNNRVQLSRLEYRFALGDRFVVTARPVGFSLSSVLTANSPYFDAGRGAVSRFAEASPAFKLGRLDAGGGFDWLVSDNVRLQAAYGVRNANRPEEGRGLFNSDHSAFGVQVFLKPAPTVLTGISYINAYAENGRLDTFTGSFLADTNSFINEPARIQGVNATLQWRVAERVTFSTWGTWLFSNALNSDRSATTTSYLFGLSYSEPFDRQGDLLALLVGQPLRLVSGTGLPFGEDEDTSLHFELFYRLRVSDRIS